MNPEVMNYMAGPEAAQDVNYTFVEAIAKALDETVQKIEDWRGKAEDEGFDFAESSMQAVQGLALAISYGVVDFSQISFIDACETGTIAYANEEKDDDGNVIAQSDPYFEEYEEPKPGNRSPPKYSEDQGTSRGTTNHSRRTGHGVGIPTWMP